MNDTPDNQDFNSMPPVPSDTSNDSNLTPSADLSLENNSTSAVQTPEPAPSLVEPSPLVTSQPTEPDTMSSSLSMPDLTTASAKQNELVEPIEPTAPLTPPVSESVPVATQASSLEPVSDLAEPVELKLVEPQSTEPQPAQPEQVDSPVNPEAVLEQAMNQTPIKQKSNAGKIIAIIVSVVVLVGALLAVDFFFTNLIFKKKPTTLDLTSQKADGLQNAKSFGFVLPESNIKFDLPCNLSLADKEITNQEIGFGISATTELQQCLTAKASLFQFSETRYKLKGKEHQLPLKLEDALKGGLNAALEELGNSVAGVTEVRGLPSACGLGKDAKCQETILKQAGEPLAKIGMAIIPSRGSGMYMIMSIVQAGDKIAETTYEHIFHNLGANKTF